MDYKEAIKIFEEFEEMNSCVPEDAEAITLAIEALKKADRYRWHDAEEELPGTTDDVLVYHTYYHRKADCIKGEIEIGDMYHSKWHGDAARGAENVIIAWKYIEPYKEESR